MFAQHKHRSKQASMPVPGPSVMIYPTHPRISKGKNRINPDHSFTYQTRKFVEESTCA
ncbi:hypothetical protein BJV78DRAFT_1166506, partial [Lactifluus subvellereus]